MRHAGCDGVTGVFDVPELRGSRSILEGSGLAGNLAAGVSKAECLALLAAGPVHGASHERRGGWLPSSVKELITLIVKLTCTHVKLSVAVHLSFLQAIFDRRDASAKS